MKIRHQITALTLVLSLAAAQAFGQDCCCQENEAYSPAYTQSCNTSHWSVYIPITLIVGAAIWFGLSDVSDSNSDSYGSQDGLGSIANSKRMGSRSSSGSANSKSTRTNYSRSHFRSKMLHSH